jgi:hypothetical protein
MTIPKPPNKRIIDEDIHIITELKRVKCNELSNTTFLLILILVSQIIILCNLIWRD